MGVMSGFVLAGITFQRFLLHPEQRTERAVELHIVFEPWQAVGTAFGVGINIVHVEEENGDIRIRIEFLKMGAAIAHLKIGIHEILLYDR